MRADRVGLDAQLLGSLLYAHLVDVEACDNRILSNRKILQMFVSLFQHQLFFNALFNRYLNSAGYTL